MPPRSKKDKQSAYFRQNKVKKEPEGKPPTIGPPKEKCAQCGKELIFEEAAKLPDGTLICSEHVQQEESTMYRYRHDDPGEWEDMVP